MGFKVGDDSGGGMSEINVTPLIDIMLVMLIIFMIITPPAISQMAAKLPEKTEFFDERGTLIRTLEYKDVRELGGKRVPMTMRLVPADKPGEYTEIVQQKLAFDVDLPDSTFTLQALKKK